MENEVRRSYCKPLHFLYMKQTILLAQQFPRKVFIAYLSFLHKWSLIGRLLNLHHTQMAFKLSIRFLGGYVLDRYPSVTSLRNLLSKILLFYEIK